MRIAQIGLVAVLLAIGTMFVQERSAFAAFHCMRIHAVMAGFNTNNSIQYVELRMNTGGQTAVSGHEVRFYDSAGTHKATFTIPGFISNGSTGDSILIGTSEFNAATLGGDADFTFSMANTTGLNGGDPLHPVQSTGGRIEFAPGFDNCDVDITASPGEVDTVGYGGGSTSYGSSAVALPSPSDNRALRLSNLGVEATNNSTEYSLQAASATTFSVSPGSLATDFTTPRNNGRVVLQLGTNPTPTPTITPTPTVTPIPLGGVAGAPDLDPSAAGASDSSGDGSGTATWIALGIAGTAAALGASVWYGRRRRAL
ncbi:MAG: hypothetical protein WEE64_12250 [Dehalococcoidia bacterium]